MNDVYKLSVVVLQLLLLQLAQIVGSDGDAKFKRLSSICFFFFQYEFELVIFMNDISPQPSIGVPRIACSTHGVGLITATTRCSTGSSTAVGECYTRCQFNMRSEVILHTYFDTRKFVFQRQFNVRCCRVICRSKTRRA